MSSSSSSSSSSRGGYKVLCVSCLHPKASDDVIRESLYREYNKKYGDVSVRVMHEPDERVAYVYFRNFDDARDAKHAKSRIILFDKAAVVEPVYENRRRSPSPPPNHSYYHSQTTRYRSRSPLLDSHHHGHHQPHHHGHHQPHHHGHHQPHQHQPHQSHQPHQQQQQHHHHHQQHHRRDPPAPPPHYARGDDYPYERALHHHNNHHPQNTQPQPHQRRYPYSEAHHRRYTKDNRPGSDHPHHGGHHGHQGGHHLPPPPPSSMASKKDKFPNYLNHIPPEDDPLSTRTLFTGNLELNITEEEMRRIFGRYGQLVDIDIKRPPPGTGNAYAFIRYENLDQAHRAKIELSGQYIGKFQCKIGYGKVNPTPKVWVGGLGSWASSLLLESEFDRFGAIQKVDYRKGDPSAYINFESIEAAQAAVQEMRGYPLGGQDKRLRMDFADMEEAPTSPGGGATVPVAGERFTSFSSSSGGTNRDRSYTPGSRRPQPFTDSPSEWQGSKRPLEEASRNRRVGSSPEPGEDRRISGDEEEIPRRSSLYSGPEDEAGGGVGIRSLLEITKKTPNVWDGGLILKNSLFPTKFYLIQGNEDVVDCLKDEADKPHLKITQRLRLDQGKLDDVSKRMKTSSSHAIFLGVSDSNELTHENPDIQSRPLRNLVTYLKQKEAAGVISLSSSKEEGGNGVLYCFPPCPFSLDLLRSEYNNIDEGGLKEDHLVIVVVCGN